MRSETEGAPVLDLSSIGEEGLVVATGGTDVTLGFDSELLRVSVSDATLTLSEFIYVRGGFAFEKGPEIEVTDTAGDKKMVQTLTFGASNAYVFAGIGGPYWNDSNDDGVIDAGDTPAEDGALGVAFGNVNVALALLTPTDEADLSRYTALKVTAGTATFVGLPDVLEFELNDITVSYNQATGPDATGPPAIDFTELTDGGLEVATGNDSITLDYSEALLSVSVGEGSLSIADFVTISGAFAFEKTDGLLLVVANEVNAGLALGDFAVGIENGTLALAMFDDGTVALEASGEFYLEGLDFAGVDVDTVMVQYNTSGLDFSADPLTIDINGITADLTVAEGDATNPYIAFSALGLSVNLGDLLRIEGDFSFSKGADAAGLSVIKIGVDNFSTIIGDGTTDYLSVTDGSGAFLINDAGYVATITASVDLQNVPGVSINDSTFTVTLANVTEAVDETIEVGDTTFHFDVDAGSLVSVTADPLDVTVLGITLKGRFSFEQTTNLAGESIIVISGADIEIPGFIGQGSSGSPIDIQDAQGLFVISDKGLAGSLSFTANISFGVFSAGATLVFEMNDTNEVVDATGVFGAVKLDAGRYTRIVLNDLRISFPGIEISGDFSFKSATINGVSTRVIVGSNVEIFVGNNVDGERIGLELVDGEAMFIQDGDLKAGRVTGTVSLVGVPALTLSATMTLRLNQFTEAVNQSVILNGETIELVFSSEETNGFIQFIGEDVAFSIADTLEIYGNLAFTRTENQFTIGVSGGEVFVGSGPMRLEDGTANPDAIGLRVYDIDFAMVVFTNAAGKYAFRGEGSVGFVGLDGLEAAADSLGLRFGVAQNKTGAAFSQDVAVTEDISIPLNFATASDAPTFIGGLTISVGDVFELSGTVEITPQTNGDIDINVTTASLAFSNGEYAISGAAQMKISKTEGFKLVDFQITGATFAGTTLTFAAGAALPGDDTPRAEGAKSVAQSTSNLGVGPLSFVKPGISLADFAFKDGKVVITLALTLEKATLAFGGSASASAQTSSGIVAELTGLEVTFDIGVDIAAGFGLSATGKWTVHANGLAITVPGVFKITGTNLDIGYDPAGGNAQELFAADRLAIEILALPGNTITGEVAPYLNPDTGDTMRGIVITGNGFTIGQAQIIVGGPFSFGSILRFDDIRVGITNWSVNFDGAARADAQGNPRAA